jgi:peptidoglycan-associated lipoprotein
MHQIAKYARSAAVATALIWMVAGCSSVKLDEQSPAPIVDAKQGSGATSTDPRAVAPVTAASTQGVDPFTDPNNPLSKKSVYFDFDSFVVKSEFQPLVEAHGKYLSTNSGRQIKVEGHTDERGGREYNLALGRRARRYGPRP